MSTVAALTEELLDVIPNGVPLSVVMESLNAILAAVILHASEGDLFEEQKLIDVVGSDLLVKIRGEAH